MSTLAAFLVVFVGYLLRLWHLNSLSISGDEVNSISFATRPLAELLTALATFEPHPPFYYGFLHGWLAIAGQSELALRFPSVLFGTLGIASAYSAGRGIGGYSAGLAAAAIFGASQYSVLQSQDGRMYAALQAWIALFLAGLVLYRRRPDRKRGAVVAVAGTLAAYTHYHGLLVVAFAAFAVVLITPRRDLLARFWPFVAIAVLYLPWVLFARNIFLTYRGWMAVVPPLDVLRRSTVVYSVGLGVPGTPGMLALFVLPCFALAGLAAIVARRHWHWLAMLLGLSALPLAAVAVGSVTGRPLFHERYLIAVTPAYYVLAGLGLALISRMLVTRLFAWTALIALGTIALTAYYWPSTPPRPDFRATAALIEREAVAPATVVLPPPQGPVVTYYVKGRLPTYTAPGKASIEEVATALARRLDGMHEAWFVRYSAGNWDDKVGRWLEANAFYLRDQWVTQNHVVTYALALPHDLVDRPAAVRVGGSLEITSEKFGPSRVHPGDRVLAGFRWTTSGTGAKDLPPTAKVSLRLIDPWGQTVAALDRRLVNPAGLAETDLPPVWGGALSVPTDAVPGQYHSEALFYDGASGRSWTVVDASGHERGALDLGIVSVEPSAASALNPHAPLAASVISVGHGLFVQGVRLSGEPYVPNAHLVAAFDWAAQSRQTGPVVPELAIRAASGDVVTSMRRDEDRQPYRLSALRPGERVRERLGLSLRAIANPGAYSVVLRTGANTPWVVLGTIDVAVDPKRYQRPTMAEDRSELFDRTIRLVGATLPSTTVPVGSSFAVTLAWHAERLPTAQYTVFLHLVGDSDKPLAQGDSIPAGGRRPTLDWALGEYVVDEHRISVPDNLPAGNYRLVAGLYEAATGRRANVDGQSVADQEVDLGTISIGPR